MTAIRDEYQLPKPKPGAGWRELVLAAAGWAALLAGLLIFTQAYVGLQQWFWLDEVITATIARDPSPAHAFGSIADGVDSNLPGLYVMLWVLKAAGVPMTEVALRGASLVALWMMLVGVYGTLRLVFSRSIAVTAILPLLMVDVVVDQAFEVRCYMFWAAASVWLAYGLVQLRLTRGRFSGWHVAVLVLMLFSMSIHYFSLPVTGSMLICDWLADKRPRREKWLSRWPVWLGLLPALLAPWLYWHQREMLSGTWMWPATLRGTAMFFYHAFMLEQMGLLAAAFVVTWILGRWATLLKWRSVDLGPLGLLAGLGGLIALPVMIIVMSWTVQPMLVARYTLPGLPALTILFALLLYRQPRIILAGVFVALLAGTPHYFEQAPARVAGFMSTMGGIGLDLGTKAPKGPIIFEARKELYPILVNLPSLAPRLYYLDFEMNEESADTLPVSVNFSLFERDAQRGMARHYPLVQSWPKDRLGEWDSFTLVPFGAEAGPADLARIAARFPGWDIYSINEHLLWLHKRPVTAAAESR